MSASLLLQTGFIRSVQLRRDDITAWDDYPYSIPVVQKLGSLQLHPKVTYLIGENGAGKSTLVEAIAAAAGLNPEGGDKNLKFATKSTESMLADMLQLVRGARREKDGFFLRAESLYNVASAIQDIAEDPDNVGGAAIYGSYGGRSLHDHSHGESFLAVFTERFRGNGLYILDEPEAALSISRQFAFLRLLDEHVQILGSQFIISTHSPILLAYPDSIIYLLDEAGIAPVEYEDTEVFQSTRDFLNNREAYLKELVPEYISCRA